MKKEVVTRAKFILIDGNQRSGTNLLLHLLDNHPELRVLPEELGLLNDIYKPDELLRLREHLERRDFDLLKKAMKNYWFFRHYSAISEEGYITPPKGTYGRLYYFPFSI